VCNFNNQIKKDEMGRACHTHGKEEEFILGFDGNFGRKETTRET
jgi:hypothetical protein